MKKKNKQKLVLKNQVENPSVSEPPYFDPEVRPNDYKILDILDARSEYTFKGIMRKLGMHQETLSRSLQRLLELGIVKKSKLGYRISDKMQNLSKNKESQTHTPILMSYLPSGVTGEKIIAKIAGSWFKGLRWVGVSQDNGQQTLQWVNGLFYINLKVLPNHVIIETNANNEKDKVDALSGAYKIVQKITDLYDPLVQINDLTN